MSKKRTGDLSSTKFFFILLCIALGILVWKFVAVSIQLFESQSKISNMKEELEELQNRQNMLKNMESFFQSDFFAEREARLKYGLQKQGEHAVIIKNKNFETMREGLSEKEDGQVQEKQSTPYAWKKFFFGK